MIRVLGPKDGEIAGPEFRADRFLVNSRDTERRIAVVEHTLGPGVLAAPMHKHTREDEYSFVIEGTLAAIFDGHEVRAEEGDFVFKPRDEWHTFWNPGTTTTRILEIITPGGLEELFRELDTGGDRDDYDPETLPAAGADYGCDVDFVATEALVKRLGLTF